MLISLTIMKKYVFQVLIISFIVSVIVNLSLKNVDSFSTLIEIIIISPFESLLNNYVDITSEYIIKPIFGSANVNFFGREVEVLKLPKSTLGRFFLRIIFYFPFVLPLLIFFQLIRMIYKLISKKFS